MTFNQPKLPFSGTKEQEAKLLTVLNEFNKDPNALLAILQKTQEIYGYLPLEVQTIISNELELPLENIDRVVSFYSYLSSSPKGKYKISICLGATCQKKGSLEIYEKLKELLKIDSGECTPDGRFSLDTYNCIGACGLAPAMIVDDKVYTRLTIDNVEEILAKYQA